MKRIFIDSSVFFSAAYSARGYSRDLFMMAAARHVALKDAPILDGGMLHAMHKRTGYGLELLHSSWIVHEFKTLQRLHVAGVNVPIPYVCDNNAILMEYIGSLDMAAPTLNTVSLEPDEAPALFERVLRNIDLMLAQECIHGDLSAYNLLYWEGEIRLIDFPQVVHPDQNRIAYTLFERDVRRICEYFTRQGIASDPGRLATELWTAHGYKLNHEIHPSLLDKCEDLPE